MPNFTPVPIVYLAGGMRGDWQDKVKKALPGIMFIDPRDHGLSDECNYTKWDLTGVSICDVVFGYLEAENPSGAGLAVEFGWGAHGGNKFLMLTEQEGYPHQRSFGMVRALADAHFTGSGALDKAIEALSVIRDMGLSAYKASLQKQSS